MKAPARPAGRPPRSAKHATGSTAKSARTDSGAKAASPPKAAGRGARRSASARAASATAEFDALLRRIHSDIDEADRLLAEAAPG